MKYAVISDLHANMSALRRVLDDARKMGAESIVCLGDVVGYGPLPAETAASVRKYFDLPLKHGDAVTREGETYPYRKGMYYFRIADGVPNYAHVMEVSEKGNVITMRGEVYSAGVYEETLGTFVATAKPHKWNGKDTWAILSLHTEWNEKD